jgi:type II secretory pathway component HofQ
MTTAFSAVPPPVKRLLLLLLLATPAFAEERTVTLDVKDEDVREILQSMKKQCGIRNLLIDADVQGKASLYIRDVPCGNAFQVVFQQFDLTGTVDENVVHVETRKN